MRYRLQKKVTVAMPNMLGNYQLPVYTYRWKDIYASDDIEALKQLMPKGKEYRIEDTRAQAESEV